jgi:hypothetical protein
MKVRWLGVKGRLSSGISDVDVTISSPGLADLPEIVAPDYAIIVLDPDSVAGRPEVVRVTAHTASATSATVERGSEQLTGGSPARSHASNMNWYHAATPKDFEGMLPASLVDAAGDLIYATAADTVARLPMGTASQVLRVNSGATGLEYATPALNGPGLVSGWYAGPAGVIDTISMAANVAMYTPFPVERNVTIDRIGLNIAAGVAASTVRLGIYGDTGGLPGTLLVDAGTINSASTGYMEITISTAITTGRVWLCAVMQGGASPVTAWAVRFPFAGPMPTSGFSTTSGGGLSLSTGPSGALPSTASTPNDIRSTPPRVMLRVV